MSFWARLTAIVDWGRRLAILLGYAPPLLKLRLPWTQSRIRFVQCSNIPLSAVLLLWLEGIRALREQPRIEMNRPAEYCILGAPSFRQQEIRLFGVQCWKCWRKSLLFVYLNHSMTRYSLCGLLSIYGDRVFSNIIKSGRLSSHMSGRYWKPIRL